MRAGLVASTVTPGSTAPDVSLRIPAMPLVCCASAVPDAHIRHVDVIKPIQRAVRVMVCLPGTWRPAMTATLLFANSPGLYTQTQRMSSRNGQHWTDLQADVIGHPASSELPPESTERTDLIRN